MSLQNLLQILKIENYTADSFFFNKSILEVGLSD